MREKIKYKLKALFTPSCWLRGGRYDAKYDRWLWNSIEAGQIEAAGRFEAVINGKIVWIANFPYASGNLSEIRSGPDRRNYENAIACSRATALYLQDNLPRARVYTRLRFPHNEYGQFEYNNETIG